MPEPATLPPRFESMLEDLHRRWLQQASDDQVVTRLGELFGKEETDVGAALGKIHDVLEATAKEIEVRRRRLDDLLPGCPVVVAEGEGYSLDRDVELRHELEMAAAELVAAAGSLRITAAHFHEAWTQLGQPFGSPIDLDRCFSFAVNILGARGWGYRRIATCVAKLLPKYARHKDRDAVIAARVKACLKEMRVPKGRKTTGLRDDPGKRPTLFPARAPGGEQASAPSAPLPHPRANGHRPDHDGDDELATDAHQRGRPATRPQRHARKATRRAPSPEQDR